MTAMMPPISASQVIPWRQLARQAALFLGIVISGGLLLFPRLPLMAGVLLLSAAVAGPFKIFRYEMLGIWLLLLAVAADVFLAAGSFQIDSLVIRYANFITGMAMLAMYLDGSRDQLARDYLPLGRFMAVQAILTPILALLVPGFFRVLIVQETEIHSLLLIFNFHDFSGDTVLIKRPDGFFFEPGVLQFYLNLYLFIGLFTIRQRWWDPVIATLGVVATQSTSGAIVLVVIYAAALLRWMKTASPRGKIIVLMMLPIVMAPVALYAAINLSDKFYGDGRGSSWARQYDLFTGLAVVRDYPFTGIGFDYDRYFEVGSKIGYLETDLSDDNITERANSNGILTLFYSIGIPLGLVFMYGLVWQLFFDRKVVVAGITIVSLSSEALFFTPFILMLAYSGILLTRRTAASSVSVR